MHGQTNNSQPLIVALLALLGVIVSACAPITPLPAGEAAPATATAALLAEGDRPTLEGVTWQLHEFLSQAGTPTMATAEATLTFQGGEVGGNTGCNLFSASYTVAGEQLTIEQGASTMMACAEPIMAQEQTLLANLSQAATYEFVAGELHILDAQGAVLLAFAPQVASVLVGVTWLATNYNNGNAGVSNVLEGSEITARFGDDGSLTGSAGCNNYTTSYTLVGDEISIRPVATTRMLCAEPAGLMEQEVAYVTALATAATYTIQGNVLELRTAAGELTARYQTVEPVALIAP